MAAAGPIAPEDAILIDDLTAFREREPDVVAAVRQGATAVFLRLPEGPHRIGTCEVVVAKNDQGSNFVSNATGHWLVAGFHRDDFKFWYDARLSRPSLLFTAGTFEAADWEPVLLSYGRLAAAWKSEGKGA